jgi:hypothetical protein
MTGPYLFVCYTDDVHPGKMKPKPRRPRKLRVLFCWECGRKLHGGSFTEHEIEGHKRVLHKICAQELGL